MTCFAVCAAMRPKFSGVTSVRWTSSGGTSDQSIVEVVVGDERVRALAVLRLGLLELRDRALARLVEQALLDVRRQLDRPDAEVAAHAVELHLRVPCRAGRLLVGGEQGVLERADERLVLDALLLLDLPDRFQDLPAHGSFLSLVDEIAARDRLVRDLDALVAGREDDLALVGGDDSPRKRFRPATSRVVRIAARRPTTPAKCRGVRSGRSRPGEETSSE